MPSRNNKKPLPLFPDPAYSVSEVELIYRFKGNVSDRPKISSSDDAYKVLRSTWDENKIELCEHFKVLYLNRANRVLSVFEVSRGSSSGTVADEKHILLAGMLQNAAGIILAHNHPSGNLTPSVADRDLTRKIKNASNLVGIATLDHIILTRNSYMSFADECIMP